MVAACVLPSACLAQSFTAPGAWSFVVPAGVTMVQVQVAGGGGGGGGFDTVSGGTGANGALLTALIQVTPGQMLYGTIGAGGGTGFTSGTLVFLPACSGRGAGGTGASAGGAGANANCPGGGYTGGGYSGGGGGGGGSTTLAVNGTVLLQAGGGGGGGGAGNGSLGGSATMNLTLTQSANCGTIAAGATPTIFFADGGAGGGGGGGFTGGAAGIGNRDGVSATAGSGGSSCWGSSSAISNVAIGGSGGAGVGGGKTQSTTPTAGAGSGFVTIITSGLALSKVSSVVSDGISSTNPKFLPSAIVQYCILLSNGGVVPSTNSAISDTLPVQTDFVPGSMRSGTTCANAATTPVSGASISGTTISVDIGTIAVGATYAFTYQVTIK